MANSNCSLSLVILALSLCLSSTVVLAINPNTDPVGNESLVQLLEGQDPLAPPVVNCGNSDIAACDQGSCAQINASENTTEFTCQPYQIHPGGLEYCRCILPCQADNPFVMGPEICKTLVLAGDPEKMNALELLQLATQIEQLRDQVYEEAKSAAPSIDCTPPCGRKTISVRLTRQRVVPPGGSEASCVPAESKAFEFSSSRGVCEERCGSSPKKLALAQQLISQLNELRNQYNCSDPNCTASVQSNGWENYRFKQEPCERRPLINPCRLSLTVHGSFTCVKADSSQRDWQLQVCGKAYSRCVGRTGER